MEEKLEVEVKYFDPKQPDIWKQHPKGGDWYDLSTREDVELKQGESCLIPLGVAMKLPEGYEAIMAPRSSTFKKFGIIQTNSIGVIDNSYCGDGDEWKLAVYATRDVSIPKYTRVAQFRLFKNQPELVPIIKTHLGNPDRGGFGSTG